MSTATSATPTLRLVDKELEKRLLALSQRIARDAEERNQLILRARAEGASLRDIANVSGMSHTGIKKLISRHLHPKHIAELDQELVTKLTTLEDPRRLDYGQRDLEGEDTE